MLVLMGVYIGLYTIIYICIYIYSIYSIYVYYPHSTIIGVGRYYQWLGQGVL